MTRTNFTTFALGKGSGVSSQHIDVLVVGGGPAGLATALCLARKGLRVVVATLGLQSEQIIGEVLPPGIRPHLVRLGVWDEFISDRHVASAGVTTWWGTDEPREWDYIRAPYGDGWHVDRVRFDSMLENAARHAGVYVAHGLRVCHIGRGSSRQGWTAKAISADGHHETWFCNFVIHAAGRTVLLHGVGIARYRLDRLVGISRYYQRTPHAAASEPRLWVEACRNGWWYTAPLPKSRIIAVFLTDADLIVGSRHEYFSARLAEAPNTSARLSDSAPNSVLRVSPAFTSRLQRFADKGFVAVGDAAYSVDPATGRGIVKALNSAIEAAAAVARWLSGSPDALSSYENLLEMEYTHYLTGLTNQYRLETRWSHAPFWRRRHIGLALTRSTRSVPT